MDPRPNVVLESADPAELPRAADDWMNFFLEKYY